MKVILIPGLLCTSQVWGNVNLIRNKYECHDADVISYDSIDEMANNLIKHASDEIALIGISMGGYVAIDAALKLGSKVKKIILINTTCKAVNPITIKDREIAINWAENGKFVNVIKNSEGFCYYQPKKEWLLLEEEMANAIGANNYIRQQKAIINRKNYSPDIEKIQSEVLIISGKNDKVIPYEDSIFMASKIKHSSLLLLDKCGHLSTLEKNSVVAEAVESFLESR